MVLVVCLDILCCSRLHQALYPSTILARLSSTELSQGLLRHDCDYRRLELLGDSECPHHVLADQIILDGGRLLQRPKVLASLGSLVSFRNETCVCQVRVTNAVRYANAAINIVTDCATALLPMGVIGSLDMPKRQKRLLLGVFGIGLL